MRPPLWKAVSTALFASVFGFALLAAEAPVRARAGSPEGALTADDFIKLVKAGLSEDIIVQQIRNKGHAFNLSTDQLIGLKAANVSDRIVEVMLDPARADVPAQPWRPQQ